MSNFASIIRRPKSESKPSIGTLLHNQRIVIPKNLLPAEYRLQNYHHITITNATKTFKQWEKENEERYKKLNKRKLRSDAHRLESLVIVLSGDQVATQDPNEIWAKAQIFKKWFENKYKTQVRTMDWHRDEGHIDEGHIQKSNALINDHIHLEFDNVNLEGKMVRKLFSKGDLIAFQDKIAEIYEPMGFVRGQKKSLGATPKRGIPQKKFRQIKINEAAKAKIKNVNEENQKLRAEMQAQGAKRADYAALEEEVRLLRKRSKENNLTIDELNQTILELKNRLSQQETATEELRDDLARAEVALGQKDAQIASQEQKIEELEEKEGLFEKMSQFIRELGLIERFNAWLDGAKMKPALEFDKDKVRDAVAYLSGLIIQGDGFEKKGEVKGMMREIGSLPQVLQLKLNELASLAAGDPSMKKDLKMRKAVKLTEQISKILDNKNTEQLEQAYQNQHQGPRP